MKIRPVIRRNVRKLKHSFSTKGLLARRLAKRGAVVSDGRGEYIEGIIPTAGERTRDPRYLLKGSRELYKTGKKLMGDSYSLRKESKVPMDRAFASLEKSLGKGSVETAVAMRYAARKLKGQKYKKKKRR